MRYTIFFHSCLLPIASMPIAYCLLPLTCSLLPAPYSLKPINLYLISIIIAISH
ncbi:hypothetical protein [Moorena sp. SIO4G3]|uniref:hypothetical protein n=1 Tax=Moorena sp. SIO4G3 TaxID=2607821 RepID=UPI00142A0C0E|nr:hypothetical protein [Moorena sp. SIO4G3]NEO82037.1 hypothetical protein [Moorena sp. SIO4G3]